MSKIDISSFNDLENLKERLQENKFAIDLNNCEIRERVRIIDFIAGLTFLNGSIKKLNCNEFEVTVNKEI